MNIEIYDNYSIFVNGESFWLQISQSPFINAVRILRGSPCAITWNQILKEF